ncbi:MAG: hypothetical protein ACI8QC_004179 [Planctomycetota bacterium]|jgi:hypothetical protein
MSLDLAHPDLAALASRLCPYARKLLTAAGERALWMHSDEVTPEHWLGAFLADEDSGAHQLVNHAFADPETMDLELVALSPGIMVVGSKAALPFSPGGLQAVRAARASSLSAGSDKVEAGVLVGACVAAMPGADAQALAQRGFDPSSLGAKPSEQVTLRADAFLFQGFSDTAKRALSQANKDAFGAGEPHIGPARLLLACLALDPELESQSGIRRAQAASELRGKTLDSASPDARELPPSQELLAFLEGLPEGSGSVAAFAAVRDQGNEELIALLDRHKITVSLLERSKAAFPDPAAD